MITDILDTAIDEMAKYQARYLATHGAASDAAEKVVIVLRAAQRALDLDPGEFNNQAWRVVEALMELDTSTLERLLAEPLTGTTHHATAKHQRP